MISDKSLLTAPGTRNGRGVPGTGRLKTGVLNRPMTSLTGMAGVKVENKGVYGDKPWYIGELSRRTQAVRAEAQKLEEEHDKLHMENSVLHVQEKRLEEVLGRVNGLKGDLADFNMIIDQRQSSQDIGAMQDKAQKMLEQRQANNKKSDQLLTQRKMKLKVLRQTEGEIAQVRAEAEAKLEGLAPERRAEWEELSRENTRWVTEIAQREATLEHLSQESASLTVEMQADPMKQRAAELLHTLAELKSKKSALDHDAAVWAASQAGGTSEESRETERATLLAKVKSDNNTIATMEREVESVLASCESGEKEIASLEETIAKSNTAATQKFQELLKRDETMAAFIESFDNITGEDETAMTATEGRVEELLKKITAVMARIDSLPTQEALDAIADGLKKSDTKTAPADMTGRDGVSLATAKRAELEKFVKLLPKVAAEKERLNKELTVMKEELVTYKDRSTLTTEWRTAQSTLAAEKDMFRSRRDRLKAAASKLQAVAESKKRALTSNDNAAQMNAFEGRLGHYESLNHTVGEWNIVKGAEVDYGTHKTRVMTATSKLNTKHAQSATTRIG